MFNLLRRVASEDPTLSPVFKENDVVDDFDLSSVNLGGNVQGLHERGLLGIKTSGSLGDNDITRRERSNTSRGSNSVIVDQSAGVVKIAVGEDESNVASNVGEEGLELGVLGNLSLDHLSDHGVLAHKNLSRSTETSSDLLHVRGSNIVSVHKEDLVVLLKKDEKLLEVDLLSGLGVFWHRAEVVD